MSFRHRLQAIGIACLASAALVWCFVGGTTCKFLRLEAVPGNLLLSAQDVELMAVMAGIGVTCENEYYVKDDRMWRMSRQFLYVSLALGGTTVLLAWSVATFVPPTNCNWRILSSLSAITAVLQVPIFLMYNVRPCSQERETQFCNLSLGAYFMIASTSFWILVTLFTQCLDPPAWALELAAWRLSKSAHTNPRRIRDEELGNYQSANGNEVQPDAIIESFGTPPRNRLGFWKRRFSRSPRRLRAVRTASMNEDDFDLLDSQQHDRSGFDFRIQPQVSTSKSHEEFEIAIERHQDLGSLVDAEDVIFQAHSPPKQRATNISNDGPVAYINPSVPSQATERIVVLTPERIRKDPPVSEYPPMNHGNDRESFALAATAKPTPLDASEILADLELGETPDNANQNIGMRETAPSNRSPSMFSQDNYTRGLQSITKKLKSDSHRQRSRQLFYRRGYQPMFEDDDDTFEDEPFMSPPIEVKIVPFASFDDIDFLNGDNSDEEKDDLMVDWNALHRATSAGVRLGLQEGNNNADFGIDFDAPVDGYASDPEPAYYESDDSRSETSLPEINKSFVEPFYQDEDNSTISSGPASPMTSTTGSGSRRTRRRRMAGSPSTSHRSGGSLLAMTIDEETEKDVLEEVSVEEQDRNPIFPRKRSYSAPEQKIARLIDRYMGDTLGRTAFTVTQRKERHRSTMKNHGDASTISTLSFRPIESDLIQRNMSNQERTETSNDQAKTYADTPSLLVRPQALPASQVKWQYDSKSVSSGRDRRKKSISWKSDAVSLGDFQNTRTPSNKESRSENPPSSRSQLSLRAREFRIKRMQQAAKGDQQKSDKEVSQDFKFNLSLSSDKLANSFERDAPNEAATDVSEPFDAIQDRKWQNVATALTNRMRYDNMDEPPRVDIAPSQQDLSASPTAQLDETRYEDRALQLTSAASFLNTFGDSLKPGRAKSTSFAVPDRSNFSNYHRSNQDFDVAISTLGGRQWSNSPNELSPSYDSPWLKSNKNKPGQTNEVTLLGEQVALGSNMPGIGRTIIPEVSPSYDGGVDDEYDGALVASRFLTNLKPQDFGGRSSRVDSHPQDRGRGYAFNLDLMPQDSPSSLAMYSKQDETTADDKTQFSTGTEWSMDPMKALPLDTDAVMKSLARPITPDTRSMDDKRYDDSEGEDSFKYTNTMMEDLDLQLIEIQRPIGLEYGEDEASL